MSKKNLAYCSFGLSLAILLLFVVYYERIPSLIPSHYNLRGEVDSWGDKSFLWYIVLANILINIFLYLLSKYPRIYNYPFPINESNQERVYTAASLFIRTLQLLITLIVSSIIFVTALAVEKIPVFVMLFILFAPLMCVFWGIRKILKANK